LNALLRMAPMIAAPISAPGDGSFRRRQLPLPNDAHIGADLLHTISVQSARSPLNEGHESLPSDARPALDLGFRYRPVQAAYFRLIADGVDSIFTRKRSMIFFKRTAKDYSRFNYLGERHSHPSFCVRPSLDRPFMRQFS